MGSTDRGPRAFNDPQVQFLQMLRVLRWSAGVAAAAVGFLAPRLLVLGMLAGLLAATLAISTYR